MKQILCLMWLLFSVVFSLCAQKWTPQDSLQLQKLLQQEGELELNSNMLKELEKNVFNSEPIMSNKKSWMEFDESLPFILKKTEKKVRLTLHPYTPTTKYNWDPVYQRKIDIDKPKMTVDFLYSNWAKSPLDAGPRESIEQIEATGLRYRFTERVGNMTVGSWQGSGGNGVSGLDLMYVFTKDFWNRKAAKRRARTREVLKAYGDSITVHLKERVIPKDE